MLFSWTRAPRPYRWLFAAIDIIVLRRHRTMIHKFLRREPDPARSVHVAFPSCANDKFHWRKVFDHNPLFVTLADKIEVKDWIRQVAPELGVARLLWQGTDPAQIPDALLQQDVVIKASHSYKANIIVTNGCPGKDEIVPLMRRYLARDHGHDTLQWGYFDIPRRVLVEEKVGGDAPLHELKYHMFGSRVERVVHIHDRWGKISSNVHDRNPNGAGFIRQDRPGIGTDVLDEPLPKAHDLAIPVMERIGAHFDHVRLDLMTDGEKLWFGELTFYPLGGIVAQNGHDPNSPTSRAWDLRKSWFLST